jgi:hypothetical protein
VSEPRSIQYVIFEGVVSGLATAGVDVKFTLVGRRLSATAGSAAALLHNGDYVRVLIRVPRDAAPNEVLALQWGGETEVHYTGARMSASVMIVACLLILAGVYGRIWWLIFATFPLVVIRLLFGMREADAIRRFEAYCRTSPTGTLRS